MNKYRTLIQDLPDLEDFDGHISEQNSLGNKEYSQVKQQHHPYNNYENYQNQHQQPPYHNPQHQINPQYPQQYQQHFEHQPNIEEQIQQHPYHNLRTTDILPEDLSCMLVHRHIEGCPICSSFYERDVSKYIIVIIALIIFIIYLLRKLLN